MSKSKEIVISSPLDGSSHYFEFIIEPRSISIDIENWDEKIKIMISKRGIRAVHKFEDERKERQVIKLNEEIELEWKKEWGELSQKLEKEAEYNEMWRVKEKELNKEEETKVKEMVKEITEAVKEAVKRANEKYYHNIKMNCYGDCSDAEEWYLEDGAKAIIRMLEFAQRFINKVELETIEFH